MFGLQDRLWVGYWIGGSSASLIGLACEAVGVPFWLAFLTWVMLTPVGIAIATRRQ